MMTTKRFISMLLVPVLLFSLFSFQTGTVTASSPEKAAGSSGAVSQATYAWVINSYIHGTTTPIIPSVTGSTEQEGYRLNVYAENVLGYILDPFEQSPVSINLTEPLTTINFYYTPKTYTLTFESNGGTPIADITANYNTPISRPTNPVRDNATFAGWYKDEAFTDPVSWPYNMPFQGGTLYAKWTLQPVTLSFNSNNGTPVAPITALPGDLIEKPTDPTRNNYRFDGWFFDISYTRPVSWPLEMPDTETMLYAKWVYIRYTVTFNSNGGTNVTPITVTPGTTVYPPNDPVREGYIFDAWYRDNGTFEDPVEWPFNMVQGFIAHAKWIPEMQTITFDTGGAEPIEPMQALSGADISPPPPPQKFGYAFAGWMLDGEHFDFDTMPPRDINLVAAWNASLRYAQAELSVGKMSNGVLNPITSARADEEVVVSVFVKTNFFCGSSRFVVMYDSDFYSVVGANKGAIIPNAENLYYANAISNYGGSTVSPITGWPETFVDGESAQYKYITANFTASVNSVNGGKPLAIDNDVALFQFKLKVKPDAEGSGRIFMDSRWDRSSTYTSGAQYYFYCTDGNVLSSSGTSVVDFDTEYTTADKTVNLDTSPIPTSTISFDSAGGTAVAPITGPIGDAVPPPAEPVKEGYTFMGWSPALPEYFPDENITLTATWEINIHEAIFMVDGEAYRSLNFAYGEQITAPADNPSKTGHTFLTWVPELGIMGDEDQTFIAVFLPNSYDAIFMVDGAEYDRREIEYGTQITLPPAPSKTGYTFLGWDNLPPTMPAEDVTMTARWSVNSYNAIFYVDGVEYARIPTPYGEPISLPLDPEKENYVFNGWTPEIPPVMPAGPMEFDATWRSAVDITLIPKAGSTTVVDEERGFIYGLEQGLSTAEFLSDFVTVTGGGILEYIFHGDDFGTGTKVELKNPVDGTVIATYYIVIFGDVNGDGLIDFSDFDILRLMASFADTIPEGEPFRFAADLTADGIIDVFDVNVLRAAVNGVKDINQVNP